MNDINNVSLPLNEIKEAIAKYNKLLEKPADLDLLFGQGNWFQYNKQDLSTSKYVHAYPAVLGDQLVFFMIPSAYDNPDTQDISKYVQVCPIYGEDKGTRIPSETALHRIRLWQENYKTWIPEKVKTEFGLFQAFEISHEDFESDVVWIALGLRKDIENKTGYQADLIVVNDNEATLVYDDFVRSVPPYGTAAAANSFYLLRL